MKRTLGLTLTVALVLLPVASALADDGRIGGEPGNVHVLSSDDIRLEAETVQAVIYGTFAEYVVDFKFVNSGAAQTVRLGFPFGLDGKSGDSPPVSLAGFQAFRDGTPLDVTLTEGLDGPLAVGWFEHQATFAPGVTMIRVRYLTRPSVMAGISEDASDTAPTRYAGMVAGTAWYPYTLHTGTGWAGTIGRAVVRYMVSADLEGWAFGVKSGPETWGTRPAGFTWPDPNTLQWILEDFEPLQEADTGASPFDIKATYYSPAYAGYDGEVRAEWAKPPVATVTASSVSPVTERDYPEQLRFPAGNAIGDPSTSWISAESDSAGAWLDLVAGEQRAMREVRIVPGYAHTPAEYLEHGRPKRIEVRFDDGTVETFDLADEPIVQRFPLSVTAKRATITVLEVYPGSAYDDVAIAAVELGSAAAPEFLTFEEALAAIGTRVDVSALVVANPYVLPASDETTEATAADASTRDRDRLLLAGAIAVLLLGGVGVLLVRRRRAGAQKPPAA